ncbi:MAG: RDD family protein, partial [Longimicrobiales bacterium]
MTDGGRQRARARAGVLSSAAAGSYLQRMPLNPSDPRTHITPDSFGVAPALLGLPLASPSRRAAAMVCDLIPLAILVGAHAVFLAIAAAVMLWRASIPTSKSGAFRRGVRATLRVGAAGLAFLIVLKIGGAVFGADEDDDEAAVVDNAIAITGTDLGLRGLMGIPDVARLSSVDDTAEARERAVRVADWMTELKASPEGRREMASELVESVPGEAERAIVASVFTAALGDSLPRDAAAAPSQSGDSLVLAYAAAIAAADSATARTLRPRVAEVVASDRIEEMEEDVGQLSEERDELRRELARAEEGGGITGFIGSIAEDLGIGFGWGALYFTSFLALWRGQTPGKWLMGVRVIRLDGQPIGWWRAFERFGGYAASLSTGLLGFLQILWDRNRQGLHDKAADTVVVRVQR